MTTRPLFLVAAATIVTACTTGGSPAVPATAMRDPARVMRSPIEHVVFIIQENRSFNNLFMGYPGAATATYGYDLKGRKVGLHAQNLGSLWDIDHSSTAFFAACDGRGSLPGTDCKMDGWDNERTSEPAPPHFAYSYVPRNEVLPYWQIARRYVLADRTFASNLDGSFVAHQYVVAAFAGAAVDFPLQSEWGCEGGPADTVATLLPGRTYGPSTRACFDFPTIAAEADAAGLTWRFYAGAPDGDGGLWSSYQADRKIFRGPDWGTDVVNPPSQFLTDIGNGELANITWITPTWEGSDHPGLPGSKGPAWVASLVNSIGTSRFWNSTAIFVMWDDWGGWYDPVQPVYEDYDGLGFRVPMLMVSAYAKHGYVTHVQYETSSVLRFIEDNFGLPHLATSDARANDPAHDAFDYRQPPRAFKKIAGDRPAVQWRSNDRSSRARPMPKTFLGDD